MLVQLCFFAAYFVVSVPAGRLVSRIGYHRGTVGGLLTAAVGCALFFPAAGARSYPLFLGALFVLGSGLTLLQVAANPAVALLGRPETASSRLTFAQAINSLGTTVGPLFGSMLILAVAVRSPAEVRAMAPAARVAYRAAEASSVQMPYLGIAVAMVVMAIALALFRFPDLGADDAVDHTPAAPSAPAELPSPWAHRPLVLGAVAIFAYVGAEVAISSFLVSFLGQPFIAGLGPAQAGRYLSFYWGGAMVGRFMGTLTLAKWQPKHVLLGHALVAIVLVALAMTSRGGVAMWSHPGRRPLQLDHVPHHLRHGDRGPRPPPKPWLGDPVHGDRGRRRHPLRPGHPRGPRRDSARLRVARRVLRVHRLVRGARKHGPSPCGPRVSRVPRSVIRLHVRGGGTGAGDGCPVLGWRPVRERLREVAREVRDAWRAVPSITRDRDLTRSWLVGARRAQVALGLTLVVGLFVFPALRDAVLHVVLPTRHVGGFFGLGGRVRESPIAMPIRLLLTGLFWLAGLGATGVLLVLRAPAVLPTERREQDLRLGGDPTSLALQETMAPRPGSAPLAVQATALAPSPAGPSPAPSPAPAGPGGRYRIEREARSWRRRRRVPGLGQGARAGRRPQGAAAPPRARIPASRSASASRPACSRA